MNKDQLPHAYKSSFPKNKWYVISDFTIRKATYLLIYLLLFSQQMFNNVAV